MIQQAKCWDLRNEIDINRLMLHPSGVTIYNCQTGKPTPKTRRWLKSPSVPLSTGSAALFQSGDLAKQGVTDITMGVVGPHWSYDELGYGPQLSYGSLRLHP